MLSDNTNNDFERLHIWMDVVDCEFSERGRIAWIKTMEFDSGSGYRSSFMGFTNGCLGWRAISAGGSAIKTGIEDV